jgi:hypothetical protein
MKTKVILSKEDCAYILTDAIETNGIQYWACDYGKITIRRNRTGYRLIEQAQFEANDKNGERKTYTVKLPDIQRAANLILGGSVEIAERIKKQILTDDGDMESADCIVQVACFGELLYG